MKQNKNNRFAALLLALCMAVCCALPALAAPAASANIDLYSGFLYDLLGIPVELYTPLFAIARIVGWSAHRIEELLSANKIIRPAYKSLGGTHDYIPRSQRA